MRAGSAQATARPFYIDRNPANGSQEYSAANVAPHAATTRFTYTVPAGKKAYLEAATAHARIQTVAAPGARRLVSVQKSVAANMALLARRIYTNVANDQVDAQETQLGLLGAGESINAITEDLSTGGGVDYYISLFRTEFDA